MSVQTFQSWQDLFGHEETRPEPRRPSFIYRTEDWYELSEAALMKSTTGSKKTKIKYLCWTSLFMF